MSTSHSPPYRLETPLTHTTGIASLLKLLCCQGNEWRDLADAAGLSIRDQRDIEAKSQGNDIHHLLVDRLVDIHEDKANILTLVLALLKLGQRGKEVVAKMVEGGFLHSLEEMEMAKGIYWVDEEKRSENTRACEIPSTTAEDTGAARNYGFDATSGSTGSATPRNTGSAKIYITIHEAKNVRIVGTKESVFTPLVEEKEGGGRRKSQDNPAHPPPGYEEEEMKGGTTGPSELAPAAKQLLHKQGDRAGETCEGTLPAATDGRGSVNTEQAGPKTKDRIVLKALQSLIHALLHLE